MQKLSVIFAILILTMNLSPCADALTEDNCQEHTHIGQNGENPDSEGDVCTPFCSCACCRLIVEGSEIVEDDNFQNDFEYPDVWNAGQLNSPAFTIWQPPRV